MIKIFMVIISFLLCDSMAIEDTDDIVNTQHLLNSNDFSETNPLLMEESPYISYENPARVFVTVPIIMCCPCLVCFYQCLLDGEIQK